MLIFHRWMVRGEEWAHGYTTLEKLNEPYGDPRYDEFLYSKFIFVFSEGLKILGFNTIIGKYCLCHPTFIRRPGYCEHIPKNLFWGCLIGLVSP